MGKTEAPKGFVAEHAEHATSPFEGVPHHNLQRKAAIVEGRAVNHGKNVVLIPADGFDLNKTIFSSVSGKMGLKRLILKARLGNEPCWTEGAKKDIEQHFEEYISEPEHKILKTPMHNREILNFMEQDCNFKCEHADGTFMDHLYFCHDYGAVHYTQHSPRVLFLHSIMGVGTNMFPMDVSQTDKLSSFLTPAEFKHIEAFPSILRLVTHQKLTNELLANQHRLNSLTSIQFFRVIDNKPLELSGSDLWIALNYQMVHQLDFLPCTNWKTEMNDPLFQVFIELYELLTKTKKMECEVKLDAKDYSETDEFGMPTTLATVISSFVPKSLKRQETIKSIADYSKKIGHNIGYKLIWAQ